jgi:hypothetical protein
VLLGVVGNIVGPDFVVVKAVVNHERRGVAQFIIIQWLQQI